MKVKCLHGRRLKIGAPQPGQVDGLHEDDAPGVVESRPSVSSTANDLPASVATSLIGASLPRIKTPAWLNAGLLKKVPAAAALMGTLFFGGPAHAQDSAATVAMYMGRMQQVGAPLTDVAVDYADQVAAVTAARLQPEALFDQRKESTNPFWRW